MNMFRKIYRNLPSVLRKLLLPIAQHYSPGRQLGGSLTGYNMRGPGAYRYVDFPYVCEPHVCILFEKIIESGTVCVDVGAHLGYMTLLMAKLVGADGRVIAFEAFPDNAKWLKSNVRLNNLGSYVSVENKAISDGQQEYVTLYPGRATQNSSWEWNIMGVNQEGQATEAVMQIASTSLDEYFQQGTNIDFVKMDIEGAENLALRGMRRILRECSPIIFVEFHPNGWEGRHELLEAGYHLYDVESARWFDGKQEMQRIHHCLAVPSTMVGKYRQLLQ